MPPNDHSPHVGRQVPGQRLFQQIHQAHGCVHVVDGMARAQQKQHMPPVFAERIAQFGVRQRHRRAGRQQRQHQIAELQRVRAQPGSGHRAPQSGQRPARLAHGCFHRIGRACRAQRLQSPRIQQRRQQSKQMSGVRHGRRSGPSGHVGGQFRDHGVGRCGQPVRLIVFFSGNIHKQQAGKRGHVHGLGHARHFRRVVGKKRRAAVVRAHVERQQRATGPYPQSRRQRQHTATGQMSVQTRTPPASAPERGNAARWFAPRRHGLQ